MLAFHQFKVDLMKILKMRRNFRWTMGLLSGLLTIATCGSSGGTTALLKQQFQIQNEFTPFQPIKAPQRGLIWTRYQGFQPLKILNLELLGNNAYGVQFHPEMTTELMQKWLTLGVKMLKHPGAQNREEQMRNHDLHGNSCLNWLEEFIPFWLKNDWIGMKYLFSIEVLRRL